MSKQTNQSMGFTLVELLIVIVVIAILAAISVVAYNGVQDRAKTTKGQTVASQVAKKAEALNTIRGNYPANVAGFSHASAPEARLDNPSTVRMFGAANANVNQVTNFDGNNNVVYRPCPAGDPAGSAAGGAVYYWDFTNSRHANIRIGAGC